MSELTSQKEVKQIRKFFDFAVLCLCLISSNFVYAQGNRCEYSINGICTTEDIGGVQASKVSIASSLSEIDRQITVLNAILSMPIGTPDYSGIGGFMTPEQVQQGYQNYLQMERLNQQRYQTQLQTLLQERARQANQQTANETYRLNFENYNNFTVNVIFETQERGIGAKRTGTIVLGARETKEITDTFVDPKNIVLITRRLGSDTSERIEKEYYESGKLKAEFIIKNGEEDVIVKHYYENGKLQAEAPFKNKLIEGNLLAYDESGNLQSETPHKKGVIDGIRKDYYEKGKLKSEIPYTNGLIEGIGRYYYESGKLLIEIPYTNSVIEGIGRDYYESGKLREEKPFKNNVADGISKIYREENGELWFEVLHNKGEQIGTCPNGRTLTNAELVNWQNGHDVSCGY